MHVYTDIDGDGPFVGIVKCDETRSKAYRGGFTTREEAQAWIDLMIPKVSKGVSCGEALLNTRWS